MKDKLDELHYIYKMIGNYGFCTVQELLDKYNKQLDNWNKLKEDLKLILDYSFGEDASSWDKIYGEHAKATLKFMEELEQGSDDSNGRMEKR